MVDEQLSLTLSMRPTVLITQEPEDVEEMEQLQTHHQKNKFHKNVFNQIRFSYI
jgi:hypothetical protein